MEDLLTRLDRVGVHQSVTARYCAEAAAEIRRLRTGIAYAAQKIEQANGPAMIRQAHADLQGLIAP